MLVCSFAPSFVPALVVPSLLPLFILPFFLYYSSSCLSYNFYSKLFYLYRSIVVYSEQIDLVGIRRSVRGRYRVGTWSVKAVSVSCRKKTQTDWTRSFALSKSTSGCLSCCPSTWLPSSCTCLTGLARLAGLNWHASNKKKPLSTFPAPCGFPGACYSTVVSEKVSIFAMRQLCLDGYMFTCSLARQQKCVFDVNSIDQPWTCNPVRGWQN